MSSTQRVNLYRLIHKAMRLRFADVMVQCGQTNPNEERELLAFLANAEDMLQLCTAHLNKENHFVHSELLMRQHDGLHVIETDHKTQQQDICQLLQKVKNALNDRVISEPDFYNLSLEITQFIAHNLTHMAQEETEINAALWANFSDDELKTIEKRIKQSVPPDEMMVILNLMLAATHHAERIEILVTLQRVLPSEVIVNLLHDLGHRIDKVAWARLSQVIAQAA